MTYRSLFVLVSAILAVLIAALALPVGGTAYAANPVITATLKANGHTVTTTTIDLTVGGVVQGNILGGVSNASPQASATMLVASFPDDASFTYTCDGGPSTTYTIPTPSLVLNAKYKLTCPSTGTPITASSPIAPGATDAFLILGPASVGGVADVASLGPSTAGGSGLPAGAWAGIALGALAVTAAGGGAWYVRRRGLREE